MTDSSAHGVPEADNDRQAVREYLDSELYRVSAVASQQPSKASHDYDSPMAWMPVALRNLWQGIAGLAVLLILAAGLFPLAMDQLQGWPRPTFYVLVPIALAITSPAMVCFAFATVTPLFWHGPLSLRFVIATAAVLPGCFAFYLGMLYVDETHPSDFWEAFAYCMYAQFLAAAVVAVSVQMWSRWTLSHCSDQDQVVPPTGLRSMMELTVFAAVGCAIWLNSNAAQYWQGIAFFGMGGFLLAITVIVTLVAFLRPGVSRLWAAVTAVLIAHIAATAFSGFFAVMEFGTPALVPNLPFVSAVALAGTVVIVATAAINLYCLKRAGWVCLRRGRK